jgi:hypothetical protein
MHDSPAPRSPGRPAPLSAVALWGAVAAFAAIAVAFYITSPREGDFIWSDSPRHALNGAFLLDLLRDHPLDDPVRWAYDYYLRYPALTILFYPPLFYALLVPVYAVLGVSQSAALVLSAIFALALGTGVFALARRVVPAPAALAAGIAATASPEMAYWARMVMLDIPAIAFTVWAIVFFQRFCDRGRTGDLAAFLSLFLCALYTKQFMAFLAPVLAICLFWQRGFALLRQRRTWIAAVLVAVALLPLVAINLKFAAFNFKQASSAALLQGQGWWDEWTYYLRGLPDQLGWPLFLAGLLGLALVLGGRLDRRAAPFWVLILGWIVLCYAMFSPIALKSLRFTLPLVVPWSILAAYAVVWVARAPGSWIALAGAAAICLYTLAAKPVGSIKGIERTVAEVVRQTPRDSNVMFSGKYDGAFVFGVRALADRQDLSVIRADKVLIRVQVLRELGIEGKDLTDDQILDKIKTLGIKTIAHHVGFWSDVPIIARFEALLKTSAFTEVARIPLRANVRTSDATEMVVYKPAFPVADGRPKMPIESGVSGITIK